MKVFKLKFYANDTRPCAKPLDFDLYFNSVELALEYLNHKMPDNKEITSEVTQHWFIDYTTRTFEWEGKRYDEKGDWDYPVLYKIELDELKIITSSESF